MIQLKKHFVLKKSQLNMKFRVENNNLDLSSFVGKAGYTVKKLKEIAFVHRNDRNYKTTKETVFKYVQISDIDVYLGRIKSFRKFRGSEAPNNARRIMNYGDILVSTRRPTRGAIVAVPKEFDKAICTIFFTSLQVRNWKEVDPWYLALYLRTSIGRLQFNSMITETAYPVISDDDVESMIVIYPSIDKQLQIAKEYDDTVTEFFTKLNDAYQSVAGCRQKIENDILGEDAEVVEKPQFGLGIEEIVEDNGNTEDKQTKLVD